MFMTDENSAHEERTRLIRAFNALMEVSKVGLIAYVRVVRTSSIEGKRLGKSHICGMEDMGRKHY